ncbi:hypothetical protein C2845_PM05G07930 [Panicum miliaceum]|uniref:F-box domain-containing protein n=1 Tax=Panicum miliaceum TaxID=4540 RepID=A0A3L6T338_PANMI|nr:hypothetical protein C2845_PM05G07930 [Panicum miliaceum]
MRKRSRRGSPPPAFPLPLDLVLEVAARSDPATLVRCAASSKDVRRRVPDPAFRQPPPPPPRRPLRPLPHARPPGRDAGPGPAPSGLRHGSTSGQQLPASFHDAYGSAAAGRKHILLATKPTGSNLCVLVADDDTKISIWSQSGRSPARWGERPEAVIKIDGMIKVRLEWFAERSGVVLISAAGSRYFWLDLPRSWEIFSLSAPPLPARRISAAKRPPRDATTREEASNIRCPQPRTSPPNKGLPSRRGRGAADVASTELLRSKKRMKLFDRIGRGSWRQMKAALAETRRRHRRQVAAHLTRSSVLPATRERMVMRTSSSRRKPSSSARACSPDTPARFMEFRCTDSAPSLLIAAAPEAEPSRRRCRRSAGTMVDGSIDGSRCPPLLRATQGAGN